MALFNIGISKIELSDIASDGDVGTAFAALGMTQEGTCKLNFADGTLQELKVEEKDTAADSVLIAGEKSVDFTVADPDEDTLVSVFGGTKSGTGLTTKYKSPLTTVSIEKSLKITPKVGLGHIFPRVLITAKLTPDAGKANWIGVAVSCKVLAPKKDGVSDWETFRV